MQWAILIAALIGAIGAVATVAQWWQQRPRLKAWMTGGFASGGGSVEVILFGTIQNRGPTPIYDVMVSAADATGTFREAKTLNLQGRTEDSFSVSAQAGPPGTSPLSPVLARRVVIRLTYGRRQMLFVHEAGPYQSGPLKRQWPWSPSMRRLKAARR